MAALNFNAPPRSGATPRQATLADEPTTVSAPFRPLDPDIVSEAIPAFFIGRNRNGFWVAREVHGRVGGIFLRRNSAESFAREHGGPAGCATVYPSGRFELDLANRGNPLIAPLAALIGFARHPAKRLAALIGRMTGAVERPTRDL